MRFYLSFLLVFICVFATAQVPPMAIGGSQGIDVNRILVRNWLTTPIYADTPSSPLTGSGWPGRGYLITVVKNETPCQSCPPKDTSLWVYTGARWKRVGMDYVTRLVYGGQVSKASGQNLNYIIQPYGAFFDGDYRSSLTNKVATLSPKISDNTGRIDVLVLNRDSFKVKTGIPKITPQKPLVTGSEIEVASFYFRAFDTIPTLNAGSSNVSNIYRVAGIDSIYFTIDTLTFAIKDSIGVAVATNGLTANGKNIKLGGSLTENTNINLSSNELRVLSGSDTARFVNSGGLNLIVKGSGNSQAVINQNYVSSTNTSTGRSAYLESSGSLGLNNGTHDSYLDNLGVTNPLVTLRFPNKPSGDYIIATTSDLSAANGLTKDSTVFRLGGFLNQNTSINLSTRRLNVIGGTDTTRFFANGSVSVGATPSDSTYRFNVNGGAKMDSLVVDSLYAKFGRYIGDDSTPFAPIEFRATSGNRTRIDLRPASNAGWNNNWYGAITHNGPETDIFSANYGSLYLGSSFWTASNGVYIGNTRNNPSMYVRSNNNVLIGDTANTGFRFDVNGRARVRDTLTLSTTPVTSDTTANDLLVINSSNGQVRRYTGAWPVPGVPTLQQVTTAGKVTTDTIKAAAFRIPTAIGTDVIFDDDGQAYRASFKIAGFPNYAWIRGGQLELINGSGFNGTLNNINGTKSNTISLPDSSGVLTQKVSINGVTKNTANNGVVDLGNTDTATVVKAYVTNAEAVTITKGQVVYIFGASGDRAAVKLAKNTSDTFSSKTLGIVRDDIGAGAAGWVTTQGQVSGINLGAYTPGDILWLDSVPGGFTKTKPVAPLHSVFVGVVERANVGNGLIYVKPQNGVELDELHDMKITSVANNDIIQYDSVQKVWKNVTFETAGNIKTATATLDFGNTSAQNSADLTITVTGAAIGDVVSLGVPNGSVNANACFTAWVSSTDTITVRFNNYSSGAIDPASGTFKVKVFK